MDVCEISGPWGRHIAQSYSCEDFSSKNEEFVPRPDKTHAVQQLLALLPTRPDVAFLRTDPPFLLRFLRAKKFRVGDAFLLLCRYFEYRQRHRELFRGLNVGGGGDGGGGGGGGENGIQAALLDGLPGVLAERDPCGRPVIVLLASNWDHSRYDVRVVYQAVLLTLERLVEDEAVQAAGVVVILDWSNFPARLTTSLSPKLLRLMLDGLQDAFPLRLGALHLVNQPWYVEAALGLARPFLKEKLRSRVHVHGNNLATLHVQVPPRLLPAELGGEGGEYHAHTWAATMLKSTTSQQNLEISIENPVPAKALERSSTDDTLNVSSNTVDKSFNSSVSDKSFASISDKSFATVPSSSANSTMTASPNTPLVNKLENGVVTNTTTTNTTSFAAMLFGGGGGDKADVSTNGNISEGEDIALKAH